MTRAAQLGITMKSAFPVHNHDGELEYSTIVDNNNYADSINITYKGSLDTIVPTLGTAQPFPHSFRNPFPISRTR